MRITEAVLEEECCERYIVFQIFNYSEPPSPLHFSLEADSEP